MNLNLNMTNYLNWNKLMMKLFQKVKNCKEKLTQIYQILNKVHKMLSSIQKIKISHFKKSWNQKIEYLTEMQIKFARDETCKIINTHYRKLKTIVKKTKNIMMYNDASQTWKKIAELKTEIETAMIFTYESVKCSKATSVIDEIIIMKAKLQAINNAIVIYSEEAFEDSEIWVYTDSQIMLQRLKAKSNVNLKLFNNIQQNLINLQQNWCHICIQWVLSCKDIIENEAVNQLIKDVTWKRSTINIRKRIIMNFIKKQIDKEIKEQWLIAWNDSIKKEYQYQKHTARVNLSYKLLKKLWKINRLTFSTFIQLKMRHDYFKSYLHQLSKNNSNICYEICKTRQMLKHLLLNCKHYKAEQLQLKAKAQFKNMNIILMLFIIKIERITMLKYLKSTWIVTRKWLLKTEK